MEKLFKVLFILIVIVGIFTFGYFFRPTPKANATIFDKLARFVSDMPRYGFKIDDIEQRETSFNGNKVYFKVDSTKDSIERILTFYEKRYSQPVNRIDRETVRDILERVDDPKTKESIWTLYAASEGFQPYFRLQGSNWGFFGAYDLHHKDLEIGSAEYADKIIDAFETGILGGFGIGRMVIAVPIPDSDENRILSFWTDRNFDINKMLPDKNGDFGGKDVEYVVRYPGSNRTLCVEQKNKKTGDTLLVYNGGGSITSNMLYYKTRMIEDGWSIDPTYARMMNDESKNEKTLFFSRPLRECIITVSSENTGKIITTVLDRKTRKG